jgi:hypothetical protein
VAELIAKLDLTLLDAASIGFILGDTPQPDSELASIGFAVPLTKGFCLEAKPTTGAPCPLSRRAAKVDEVKAINQWQYDNCLNVVIGPDPSQLAALGS